MWLTRAGSASTSISTIFPRLTVKPRTENGRPSESHETAPRLRSPAPVVRTRWRAFGAGTPQPGGRAPDRRGDGHGDRQSALAQRTVDHNDGFEYPLLLLVILLVLGYFGPGRYALDSELGIALPIQPVFWAGLVGVLSSRQSSESAAPDQG
jgi:hypothetical protein